MTKKEFAQKMREWYQALPDTYRSAEDLKEDPRYAPLVEQVDDLVVGLLENYGHELYDANADHYFIVAQYRSTGKLIAQEFPDILCMLDYTANMLGLTDPDMSHSCVPDELDMVPTAKLFAALRRRCRRYLFIGQMKEDDDRGILTYFRYPKGTDASRLAMRAFLWENDKDPIIVVSDSESEDSDDDGEDWKNG